jgi:hypothetical protein
MSIEKQKATGKCPACGALTRRLFEPGRGKGSRMQHPKFHKCENGHRILRKRGQSG